MKCKMFQEFCEQALKFSYHFTYRTRRLVTQTRSAQTVGFLNGFLNIISLHRLRMLSYASVFYLSDDILVYLI